MNCKVGIILGSGLSNFKKELTIPEIIKTDNDGFHEIEILHGKINAARVFIFSGRKHYYEGYDFEKILENAEAAKRFGIKLLIVTNAAGGLNTSFRVPDLMVMTSHVNFNPERIPVNKKRIFYNYHLTERLKSLSLKEKLGLRFGSYCCAAGPMYETKSEIKFFRKMGIDAIGMSTVPEIIYSASSGICVIGISCITNLLRENDNVVTDHKEVVTAGKNAYKNFSKLLNLLIVNADKLSY